MTTSICLPSHILDANITPRAREVLMVLASQTTAAEPALWICQRTVAERLRCSVATVARAIQKLIEAKLIADTGKLHQGKYKFYHVRWSVSDNLKAVERKIKQPVRLRHCERQRSSPGPAPSLGGGEESFVRDRQVIARDETPQGPRAVTAPPPHQPSAPLSAPSLPTPPSPAPTSTISPAAMQMDNRIAYYAEIARKQYEENKRRYNAMLLELR